MQKQETYERLAGRMIRLCFLLLVYSGSGLAQTGGGPRLQLIPAWGSQPLVLVDAAYETASGQHVTLEVVRFYAGHFTLYAGGKPVWTDGNAWHLLDAEKPESLIIKVNVPEGAAPDSLSFLFGTDSLTNVSGALAGDLDPSLGMYWAWNSGYINAKIEGTSPACPARNHRFQYHIGGYMPPRATSRMVSLPVEGKEKNFCIYLNINELFGMIDLSREHTVMIPGEQGVRLAQLMAQCFHGNAQQK